MCGNDEKCKPRSLGCAVTRSLSLVGLWFQGSDFHMTWPKKLRALRPFVSFLVYRHGPMDPVRLCSATFFCDLLETLLMYHEPSLEERYLVCDIRRGFQHIVHRRLVEGANISDGNAKTLLWPDNLSLLFNYPSCWCSWIGLNTRYRYQELS